MPKTKKLDKWAQIAKDFPYPKPIATEQRICFGIDWFATEADAMKADANIRAKGITYNGGWYDGMPCGRDRSWDKKDADGVVTHFAVTN